MFKILIRHLFVLLLFCLFISCTSTQTENRSKNIVNTESLKINNGESGSIVIKYVFTIARPVENVFAYLIDPDSVPEWQTDIDKQLKITEGSMRVGTVLRNTKRSLWDNYQYKRKVTDFIPLKTYGFYNDDKSLKFKMRYDLEAVNDRTRMTVSGQFKKPTTGLYSFMPQWILKYGIKKVFLKHNTLLKINIEKKSLLPR